MNKGLKNNFFYLDNFFAIFSSQTKVQAYKNFFFHFCFFLQVYRKDEKSLQATIVEFISI